MQLRAKRYENGANAEQAANEQRRAHCEMDRVSGRVQDAAQLGSAVEEHVVCGVLLTRHNDGDRRCSIRDHCNCSETGVYALCTVQNEWCQFEWKEETRLNMF